MIEEANGINGSTRGTRRMVLSEAIPIEPIGGERP